MIMILTASHTAPPSPAPDWSFETTIANYGDEKLSR